MEYNVKYNALSQLSNKLEALTPEEITRTVLIIREAMQTNDYLTITKEDTLTPEGEIMAALINCLITHLKGSPEEVELLFTKIVSLRADILRTNEDPEEGQA